MEMEVKYLLKGTNRGISELYGMLESHTGGDGVVALEIEQYYIVAEKDTELRVRRIVEDGHQPIYMITSKRNVPSTLGEKVLLRYEDELEIDSKQYEMLKHVALFGVKKKRFVIDDVEIDFYENGLVLMEIELESQDDDVVLPSWLHDFEIDVVEVTHDPQYKNQNIARQLSL